MHASVHAIISTHTTRHLRMTLWSLACQQVPPASITITCDNNSPEIGAEIRSAVRDFVFNRSTAIQWVSRPHHGIARLNQVRNNGLRALIQRGACEGRILILDGDILCLPRTIAEHGLTGSVGLTITSRILTSEDRTSDLTDLARLSPAAFSDSMLPNPSELAVLLREDRNARFHLLLRRASVGPFCLTKSHKPKIVGAHFSVDWDLLRLVNGFDECYEGYGMDDDDFGRRCHQAGASSCIAIARIPVFHLYHPSRMVGRWEDQPGFSRFSRRDLPFRCDRGIEGPVDQHPTTVTSIQ